MAYPFAYQTLAYRIVASPAIALVTSEPRMAADGWQPMAAIGRPRLIEDREGQIMKDELLTQELRKFPPARALADSMLLRQENWWYVPRVIVAIDVESVRPVVARTGGTDQQVLAAHGPDGLVVDTVRVADGGPGELQLISLAGRAAPDGPAVVLGHDFSAPDLERWTPWVTRGELANGTLAVTERPERTTLEPTPKLRQRYRRHRELQKACRAALKAR